MYASYIVQVERRPYGQGARRGRDGTGDVGKDDDVAADRRKLRA